MAPIKRKGETAATSSQQDAASRKRLRTEGQTVKAKDRQSKPVQKDKPQTAVSSIPKESTTFLVNTNELPAFPRGGASLLTPLERKQIQVQATRDVLFEQNHANGAVSDSEGLSDADSIKESAQKAKERKFSKMKNQKINPDSSRPGVRIEGLNYKRLAPGSILLGRVSSINSQDVTVSLPNNLTGFVQPTSISPQVTALIEDNLNNKEDFDEIDLRPYIQPGQYVRVYVASTGSDVAGQAKQKKHIELSLEPKLCNNGIQRSDIVTNSTIQASVRSVEDHGLIMDLGLVDENVQGFISAKDLGETFRLSEVSPGAILLCQVLSNDTTSRTIKLSLDSRNFADSSKNFVRSAPTIDSFLPGTTVEILLTEVTSSGLAGKVMGMLDVVCDIVHSTARGEDVSLPDKFSPGEKIKGRLISTFPLSENKKLGFSILNHILGMTSGASSTIKGQSTKDQLPISTIVDEAVIDKVDGSMGLYLSLGSSGAQGFAHISNLSDQKVDNISASTGAFKLGSKHKVRITGYSPLDDLYLVSLKDSVLSQPFLRVDDVEVGSVVKGKIQKLVLEKGLLFVELADGVTGMVPELHMSDLGLQHPEKKFREGSAVNARVLKVDVERRQIRLTLKKSLVNSDMECWKSYGDISIGHTAPGTLIKVRPHGAVVQFFSDVHGFLPVSEMSEAYIKDATQHFREGQVVTVNAINVDPDAQRLTVSCRDPSVTSSEDGLKKLKAGAIVSGTVFEKSDDDLLLRLDDIDVIARLELDHITDGSEKKRRSALSKIRVGQKLQDLMVLEILSKRRIVRLSNKSSLIKAIKTGELLTGFADLKEGKQVTGFCANIRDEGVFVCFAGGLTGLLPKSRIPSTEAVKESFGMARLQSVTATISSVDYKGAVPKFWLTQTSPATTSTPTKTESSTTLIDPVDANVTALEDLSVGVVIKARIFSVKDTQLNVELAKDVQGRIDISELFDDWNDIKDRKRPLRIFDNKQILKVRVLGAHDARNHRFLPITHRSGKAPVFELSAKPSFVKSNSLNMLTLDQVKVGSSWIAYVNNIADNYLWVNLSPNVRGRIAAMDVTDDISLLADLEANFPIGSALKVHVTGIDVEKNRLDLSAKSGSSQVNLKGITKGMILPGRVTKVSERQALVQLSDTIVGAVNLIDMADDFIKANPLNLQKNDIVRTCVLSVDVPNKKVVLSLRPSRVFSSSLPVEDPEISSLDQLSVNDVRRGFITNITEKGIFVALAHNVTAFVRVANLSDRFLKDWQEGFQRDQLVKGKIIIVDKATNHVQMSLKESVLKGDYLPPLAFTDLKIGQVVSGKVAKVEEFGVFIIVDNSTNVRGLCHRSEIADQRVQDARTLFSEGDAVKAKVLKIEASKRRVNFGLKASYFTDVEDEDMEDLDDDESLSDEEAGGVDIIMNDSDSDSDEDELNNDLDVEDDDAESVEQDELDDMEDDSSVANEEEPAPASSNKLSQGLSIGGFDWAGADAAQVGDQTTVGSNAEGPPSKPKKKRRAEAVIDRTGDLDAHGPQSTDDYERLLLGEPDSSLLWLQYMAFHLELGETDQARQIAQRALQTIAVGQDAEKLNIWVAMLNLENTYGDDDSISSTFKNACQYNDTEEIHSRLASIYIQSAKLAKADELFQNMIKKFSQNPKTWINYATFLFDSQADAERGRQLLSRALQTLPKHTHVDITSKFAALEFRSPNGDSERGRTIFEGLLDSFPKRVDLWNVLLDLELRHGEKDQVRNLFERIFSPSSKIKNKQAKHFFKRWLDFEMKEGDERSADAVKARAVEFVKQASKE